DTDCSVDCGENLTWQNQTSSQSRERRGCRQNDRGTCARQEDRQRGVRPRRIPISGQSKSAGRRGPRRWIKVLISWQHQDKADQDKADDQTPVIRTERRRQKATRPRKSCSSTAAPKS